MPHGARYVRVLAIKQEGPAAGSQLFGRKLNWKMPLYESGNQAKSIVSVVPSSILTAIESSRNRSEATESAVWQQIRSTVASALVRVAPTRSASDRDARSRRR